MRIYLLLVLLQCHGLQVEGLQVEAPSLRYTPEATLSASFLLLLITFVGKGGAWQALSDLHA